MKKIILLILSIFMVASCGKTVKDNDNKLKNVKSSDIILSLPENTEAIINVKSINSVFKNFKVTENSAFGQKIQGSDIDEIKDLLKINPLKIKDLEKIGIDVNKNFGMSFNSVLITEDGNDLKSLNTVIYIPLKRKLKFLSFVKSRFKNGKLIGSKENNIKYKKEKNYIKLYGEKKEEAIYIFVKNNYLFLIVNPFSPESSLELTNNIINEKTSLRNSKIFQETTKISKTDEGIYFYGNIENFIKDNKKAINKEFDNSDTIANLMNSYRSISTLLTLDTKEFSLNASVVLNDGNLISLFKDVKYNNSTILGLDKPAAIMLSYGLNVKEYANLVKSFAKEYYNMYSTPELHVAGQSENTKEVQKENTEKENKFDNIANEEIAKLNKEFGFDIEKDLIDNFNGNFAYASYDGMSITKTNYNTIISIGLKNIKTAENIIDKILANKKFEQFAPLVNKTIYKEKTVYIINAMITQIYIGFKENELIITSSKEMFDSALNSKKETGFYKYSKNTPKLLEASKSDMIFYISFLEVIKAMNNFKNELPSDSREVIDVLELLNYFLIQVNSDGNTFSAKYVLRTHSDKPFFVALIDYINKNEKKKELTPVTTMPEAAPEKAPITAPAPTK